MLEPVPADSFENEGEHFILLPWRQSGKLCITMLFDVDRLRDGLMPTEIVGVPQDAVARCGRDTRKLARLMNAAVTKGVEKLRKRRAPAIALA